MTDFTAALTLYEQHCRGLSERDHKAIIAIAGMLKREALEAEQDRFNREREALGDAAWCEAVRKTYDHAMWDEDGLSFRYWPDLYSK